MARKAPLWPLDAHTRGKHLVLKHYLEAWFPKLGFANKRLLFIDGFAGPGEYAGGEPGSPIIALETLVNHRHRDRIASRASFIFIEKKKRRFEHLCQVVARLEPGLPPGWFVNPYRGAFDETLGRILDMVEEQGIRLAPTLVMVDPFGVSRTPMSILARILRNDRAEVFVTFMFEAIRRFKRTGAFERHLDALFGCAEWRAGLELEGVEDQKTFFFDLYQRQLRAAGARQVVQFELYDGNRLVYAVFFATKSWHGADTMKQAIWKAAPSGSLSYRGSRSGQLALGLQQADFRPLQDQLSRQFRGRGWIAIETLEQFVGSDQSDFHTGQIKGQALRPMEEDGRVEVDPKTRKRAKTFPHGSRLRFL